MHEEFMWSQRYRPKTIDQCILPDSIKSEFKNFIAQGQIPNFILNGSPGTGKTTAALAMCEEIGADVMFIAAANENGIDVIRTKITQFVTARSFDGNLKVVILDEGDRGSDAFQDCLKTFIETHSKSTRFIITTNNKGKIIPAVRSRCTVVDFVIPKEDKRKLMGKFLKRIKVILDENDVQYEPSVVAEVIDRYYPDNRRILNELQRYSASGAIDVGILAALSEDTIDELVAGMKAKNFGVVRAWVAQYGVDEPAVLYRTLYNKFCAVMVPKSIPEMVLVMATYQVSAATVIDYEINNLACIITLMTDCTFK